MMRRLILGGMVLGVQVAAANAAGPAVGVAGGEHEKFSRVVIDSESRPFELSYGRRRASVTFPGAEIDFALDRLNANRSAHRVIRAAPGKNEGGARIDFDLTCDCGARVEYSRSGRLIVDFSESYPREVLTSLTAAPGGESAKSADVAGTPSQNPPSLASSGGPLVLGEEKLDDARTKMIAMLTKAASQGLVEFRSNEANGATPATDASAGGAGPAVRGVLNAEPAKVQLSPAVACRPDDWFFASDAADGADPIVAIERLQTRLVGEFDVVDPTALRKLYWTYIGVAFGDEARALLLAFPALGEDTQLMVDVADVVADRKPGQDDAQSALLSGGSCPGVHGLIQALALSQSDVKAAADIAASERDALNVFPRRLQGEVAARLGNSTADAGDWTLAGHFKRVAESVGAEAADFLYLSARIDKHRGREDKARARFEMLATGQSERAASALFELARGYAERGEAPPEGFAEDMGIVAALSDDPETRQKAALIEARTLMSEGDFAAAFREIIRTYRETPSARRGLAVAARTLLLEAMNNGTDDARLAGLDAYFDFEEFIDGAERSDDASELHIAAARTALDYDLPNAANFALARSGAEGEETAGLLDEISRLNDVTSRALVGGAGDTGAQWPQRAAIEEDGAEAEPPTPEQTAVEAYLAGKGEIGDDTREALKAAGSDLSRLFDDTTGGDVNSAADAIAVAERAAIELRVLREAINGG